MRVRQKEYKDNILTLSKILKQKKKILFQCHIHVEVTMKIQKKF